MESIFDCAKRLEAHGIEHKLVIASGKLNSKANATLCSGIIGALARQLGIHEDKIIAQTYRSGNPMNSAQYWVCDFIIRAGKYRDAVVSVELHRDGKSWASFVRLFRNHNDKKPVESFIVSFISILAGYLEAKKLRTLNDVAKLTVGDVALAFKLGGLQQAIRLLDAAFSEIAEASDDFETEFESFVEKCRKIVKAAQASYDIRVDSGKRYRRLVRIDNRSEFGSVFCFVDTTNGNVLKADSFKAPAKGARGNIFDEHNGTARAQWTGVR